VHLYGVKRIGSLVRLLVFALCLAVCFLFIQCASGDSKKQADIIEEVSLLKDNDDKKAYLESMLIEIQELQLEEDGNRLHLGKESKQRKEFIERRAEIMKINFQKISAYFENFGYPIRAELGQYAAYTPYVVLYYSDDLSLYKEDHFRHFYGAYKFNDIPETAYYSYLLVYYQSISGDKYVEDNALSIEENIYQIFDLLDIDY